MMLCMKIYTSGLIAYETALKLYEENRAELESRFPKFFLREFLELGESFAWQSEPEEVSLVAEEKPSSDDEKESEILEGPATHPLVHENLSEEKRKDLSFLDNLCIEKNTKKVYIRENYFLQSQPGLYVQEITEGGLFAALWEACEIISGKAAEDKEADPGQAMKEVPEKIVLLPCEDDPKTNGKKRVGCRVNIEKILIEQHVVEVLEHFKESPYEVSSKGSWLIVSSLTPEEIKRLLGTAFLAEIGEITDSKERVILQGETKRFLSPPARQQKDICDRKSYASGFREHHKPGTNTFE